MTYSLNGSSIEHADAGMMFTDNSSTFAIITSTTTQLLFDFTSWAEGVEISHRPVEATKGANL